MSDFQCLHHKSNNVRDYQNREAKISLEMDIFASRLVLRGTGGKSNGISNRYRKPSN